MQRKQAIIDAAIKLFAQNGFGATSTASIGMAAGVTEPLIHYHFKSKDGLFTYVLDSIFTEYFSRLDALPTETATEFEKIENLIRMHFQFADNCPNETLFVVSECPAKLQDAAHACAQYIKEQKDRLNDYIASCLEAGVKSGEFNKVPVVATTGILLAMINGLLRRKSLRIDPIDGIMEATVEFCRRSLIQ
jgi:AcrR family transcriptional regulator